MLFVSTILFIFFLDGVVCQVDLGLESVNIELIGGSADIAVIIPICTGYAEEICDEHEMTDIEFTVIVK